MRVLHHLNNSSVFLILWIQLFFLSFLKVHAETVLLPLGADLQAVIEGNGQYQQQLPQKPSKNQSFPKMNILGYFQAIQGTQHQTQ